MAGQSSDHGLCLDSILTSLQVQVWMRNYPRPCKVHFCAFCDLGVSIVLHVTLCEQSSYRYKTILDESRELTFSSCQVMHNLGKQCILYSIPQQMACTSYEHHEKMFRAQYIVLFHLAVRTKSKVLESTLSYHVSHGHYLILYDLAT